LTPYTSIMKLVGTNSNGSKYVLTFVDNFTKYVNFYPVASTSAHETLQCVKIFVNAYGLPRRLISDRGACFTARVFKEYCDGQGIKHILTSTRYPQANGQVDWTHSDLMAALMTCTEEGKDWDEILRCTLSTIVRIKSVRGHRSRCSTDIVLGSTKVF